MRYAWLTPVVLLVGLSGATCIPPFREEDPQSATERTQKLTLSLLRPSTSRTVPQGTRITIEYTLANLTGQDGFLTVSVRSTNDATPVIIAGGVRITSSGQTATVEWDTSTFGSGEYRVLARFEAGTASAEASSGGTISINVPPEFEFTEPLNDVTLTRDPNSEEIDPIVIRWTGGDLDGDGEAEIGLDEDLDHESGNEIVLATRDLPSRLEFGSLQFAGVDSTEEAVEPGTYNIYAILNDNANSQLIANGLARIIVPEDLDPNEPTVTNAITDPAEDTQFLTFDDPLLIKYTLGDHSGVLVDLKVDTDDAHTNGNERTILSQRFLEEGTRRDEFSWNGNEISGVSTPDNIYRIFAVIDTGSGTPATTEAEGLIFRRSVENKPLIGLLQPSSQQRTETGKFVRIQWRDDDPSETATIRLTIDDDGTPGEGVETGDAEIEILTGRAALGDEVQDSYSYQTPASLEPGLYFVFAYIQRPGEPAFEHVSIAPGKILVPDPLNP